MKNEKSEVEVKQRGRPRKYPQEFVKLAEIIYRESCIQAQDVADGFGVPAGTVRSWWQALPEVEHRPRVKGYSPRSPIPALESEIADLKAENEVLKAKLAELGNPVENVDALISEVKKGVFRALTGSGNDLSDFATTLRALIALKESENPTLGQTGQVVHYLPETTEVYGPDTPEDGSGDPADDAEEAEETGVAREKTQ